MRHRIVLCDSDPDYAERVAGFVRDSEFRKEVELIVCSNPELLFDGFSAGRNDLYVIALSWNEPPDPRIRECKNIVWLSEGRTGIGPYDAPVLAKYEPAPLLVRRWLRYVQDRKKPAGDTAKYAPIAAVWSVCGGVGKSKLISQLTGVWAGMGLKLFVIGLDPGIYGPMEPYDVRYHDLSEWLYAFKSGRRPVAEASEYPEGNQIHCFMPQCSYREWYGIGRSEGIELLETAAASFGCDRVLIEAEAGWSAFTEEIWSRSDALVCVGTNDEFCIRKTEKWLHDWPQWGDRPEMRQKTLFAVNKCLPTALKSGALRFEPAFRLPYVPEWKETPDWNDPLFHQAVQALSEELTKRCENR